MPDQTVFKYGDHADCMYIVLKGCVKVMVPKKANGKNVFSQVVTIKAGYWFGELALTNRKARQATIVALEETHCAVIN